MKKQGNMNNTEVKPKFDANLPFKEAQAKPKFDASKPFIPTEEVETKPVQVSKERYDELQKSYSALDETFKDLKNTLGDLAKPFHPANVDNTYRDKVLGVDIPLISKPTTPEASEEKHDDPYKALLGVNAKQFNIKDADLNKTSPAYSANQQKLNTAYLNDLDQVKKMNQKQLVDFVNQKKAFLNKKKEEEISEARRKAGAGTINLFGVDFGVYKPTLDMFLGGKADNSLEEINIKSEYANLEVGLDNIAKLGAFEKAPEMYKNIDQTLKMSREQIIKNLQKTGNNIQNITDESAKATFNAYGEAGYENAKYPQLYKDKLAYTGYQSEVNAATNEIGAISKNISDKLKQIDDLSEQLKKDPTNESIINNIQKLSLEIKPLRTEIEKRKNFISKLSDASLELSEYAKEYEKQAIEDKRDAELMQEFGAIVGRSTVIAGKQLSNELISTLKVSGLIGLELSKSLGRNPSQAEIMKRGILDTDVSFTIPSRIKYGKPVEVSFEEGETLPDIKVNWDLVAPMAIKTTAEMMLMQGAAGPFAEFGTVGKLAGLFAGSSMVFGGDTFLQELEKGASIKEAAAITSARMLIEAGTEMINLLEFINYEKAGRKFFGNTLSKTDFIRYVGSNWKTLLPKLKAQGVDVLSFLGNFGKSVGFESLEEVMSDLGNYGLDKFIVENIKPDYKQENQFTLENEITTALTTALTMPLMSGYQAWHETKASKYIPGLLWRASQNSETFLKNLNDNFKKGNITEEFFKTGVKEVETVSNLYKTNKGKIDVAPEDEKVEYLDALYQHNKISEQFLAETDLTKKEELAKQVETALKKVQKFDKEYAPLVGNPQAQKSKAEERYIENIKSFATPESVKTASIEDLNKAKEVFADVIKDPFSPTVAAEAQKHIDLIDAEIKLREEKAKQPVAEPEPTDLDLDNKTYASKVLKLSDEEIEDLEAKGDLEELVSKDKKPKIKTAEITKRFEEAKLLQGEEKIDRLAEISLEAAKEGLFDLYKQIDAFKTAENKVTIGNIEFPVGSRVTYDDQEWEVVSVDGVGKLVQGKKTVVPSDPENIKVTKFISAEGLLEEEPEVTPTDIEIVTSVGNLKNNKQVFQSPAGKFGILSTKDNKSIIWSDTLNQAIDKADIERRRQEELNKLDTLKKEIGDAFSGQSSTNDLLKAIGKFFVENFGWKFEGKRQYPLYVSKERNRTEFDIDGLEVNLPEGSTVGIMGGSYYARFTPQEIVNAKYDAELAALEGKKEEKEPVEGVENVKKALKALDEKELVTDPSDSNYYINKNNPSERFARVSTLKGEFDGIAGDSANRGTIIDNLLRDFVAGKITSFEKLKDSYNKYGEKYEAGEFTEDFLKDLFGIFEEIKEVTKNVELISDIPTLWGTLEGKPFAGTIDLLGIRKDGSVFIIDLKTSSQNRRDKEGKYYESYKEGDTIQQSAYAELLRQRTGIEVRNITILPIQVIKKRGKYISAIANKDEKGKFTMPVTIDRALFPEQKAEAKEKVKEVKPVISAEDLIKLAAEKFNSTVDTIIRSKILQSTAKRLTGEKHISKMNDQQRSILEKYLLTEKKSRKEVKEEKVKEIKEERSKNEKVVKEAALKFKLGNISTIWNTNEKSFQFYNNKYDKIDSGLVSLTSQLFDKHPRLLKIWWEDLASTEVKDAIVNAKYNLLDLLRPSNGIINEDPETTPEIKLMELISNTKFSSGDAKDFTDVSDKWFDEKGKSIDNFAKQLVDDDLLHEGYLSNEDEDSIINAIKELISSYPNGITQSDINEKRNQENKNSIDINELKDEVALEYGINLEDITINLKDEIEEYEKQRAEEKQYEEENTDEGSSEVQEDIGDVSAETTGENPVEENTPETGTEEAKDEAKENKKQLDNPINPFRNTFDQRSQKDKDINAYIFSLVAEKLFNLAKTKDLAKEGFYISVVPSQQIPWEQLSERVQKHFGANDSEKRINDTGKYLVITDKEGKPHKFSVDGELLTDGTGSYATSVFPNTKSETELTDAKFDRTNKELEKQGKTRQWFLDQVKRIFQARKANKVITYRIGNVHQGGYEINVETPISIKQSLKGKQAEVNVAQNGKVYFTIEGETTPNEVNRPRFTKRQIDTILHIISNKGVNKTDTQERQQFVTKLIGEKFFRVVDGKKVELAFKFDKGLIIPQARNEGEVDFRTLTNEEFRDILSKITPNINKMLLETNAPFNYYDYNGKTVSKKVYSYSDFIVDNFDTYNNVSSTEVKPEYFVEVGDPVDSYSNEIIENSEKPAKPEPIVEKKEKVKTTITKESPTEKKPTKRKRYDVDESDPFKDFLKRAKKLITEVTAEQEKEAEEWFKNSPLARHINFRDFRKYTNSDAWATWKSSSTTLWKGGKFTDLYHEAWHEFTQLYLTKEQKTALYNEAMQTKQGKQAIEDYAKEINKSVSELTDLERYFAVEEMVAEDFFKYALAKKEGKELILDQRPKRNSIFRKIWNYLKEAFTGKVDLQTYYEKLYTGNINKYQRNLDNAFFGSLNKGLDGIVDGEAITLTNAETKNLYQSIDYLFGQIFENPDGRSESIPMTLMFEDNAVVSGIYKKILNTFKAEFNKTADKLDELEPGTPEYEAQERILNNLSFAIQNWNDVVKSHIDHSSFFKISKDAIKFDEDTFIDPTDTSDEEDDKNNDRDSSVVKNENVSSKEAASNETIYLIATLSTKNRNPLLPMFNLPVDFKQTWDILTKNLQGTLEYPELYSKIDKLKDKYDWAESLLKRLPDPKKEVLTEAEQRLKASFLIDIGKPKVDTHEISVNSNGEFYYTKSAATDESKVKQNWNTNFANLTPEKSQFVKYDSTQNTYLDVKELVEGFKSAFPSIKKTYEGLDKGKLFTDRIAFLSNLGIVFSEETQSSPEFINFITSFKGPIYDIFRLVDLLKSQKPQSTNPIKDLGNVKVEGDIKYFSRVFPLLLKKELEFSEQFITQSVKNAANNTVWQIRDWNYISKIYNALNDVEKYPTYQSLINEPWLKQFDTNTNPYVNGITLNSIFDLKTGERRKDGNGNYVKVELHDYNGLVLNLGTGVKNEGKTTTDLTDFEKLVQNFNTLLLYGVQEHLRYGDKSSSFATKLSHIWNPITKQLEDRKNAPIVPIDKFSIDDDSINYLPDQLYSHLAIALRGELIPMKLNHEQGIGDNWKFYKDNIKDLGIFEGILTKPTIDILKKEYVGTEGADVNEVLKKNQAQIRKDIQVYLKSQKQVLDKKLSNNLLQKSDFVSASLLKKAGIDQLKAAYVANSLLYNIEHTKTVTGDPRFYKSDGGKKDPFKRFSAFSATGRIFLTDEQTNKFLENKVNAIKDAVAKKLGVIIPPKDTKGMIRSVIFKDAKYNSKALRKEYTEYFLSKGYSQERIDEILEKYKGITEADGQGWMTLDEYKQSKLRSGSSHWTKAHEEAYQKEAAFLRGERIQGMSLEELALFVPQKWQYAGTAIDGEYTLPVFYKFSVAPLIPSMIKGKSFEQIHDNLIKQNVGLALFESGSKISGIMNPEGGFNQFYSDYEKRTSFEGEYTINPILYNYLKEQVNIDPELKGKVTFSSQMRKLLHINLFKEGKALTPKAEELEKRFGDAIEKLVSLEKERVISQMGAILKDGKWTFDAKKLQQFFVKEFEERGLPDEVIDYFQVGENGQFTYPLDASNRRDKIEKIIYSIANKRLVQQKINGEALIQLAATGFELNSDKLKDVIEDAGLPFYRVVNGKIQAMKVKIAFSEKWKPLLKLNHPDGKVIGTVERLNEAIKDDKWLKEHYKKITIVGVRIPVQGLNSQEFMEVYEFLPPSAGPVIVVSPYLVAKSGGDFDIDKLTTFFPNLFENKYTGEVKLYDSKDIKYTGAEVSKKLKELAKPPQEKLSAFRKIRRELKQEIEDYKSKKEELVKNKQDVRRSIKQLDIEIAFLNSNLDILKEAEFALTNEEDLKVLSQRVIDTIGLEGLVEATESAIEQTKIQINQRINEAKLNQSFLLKLLNTSLDELKEDINYTRANIKQIDSAINPLKEYLANVEELIYQSSAKKAYQNQIIDIMRQTLELEENFEQLISPNSTDLLEESAKILKELEEDKPKGTWTELVEFAEIGRQFKSNLVGKSNLGIAAVWNTFFALAQRGGLTLNKTYEKDFPYTTSEGDQAIFHAEIPVRINMPHNETSDGGVSLSGLMDVEGKHKISKIFEQAINGFVDVAKDDWIFFINGVKEIVPTMLFTAAAGVNNKNMIAFFNQPVIKQYVKELQQYKSLFVKFSDPDLYKDATKRAKENLVLQIGKDLTVPEFKTEFEKIFKKPEKRNTEINKFIRFVQSKAEENKQLFTTEKLSESVFNGKVFSAEEKLMVLTHFFELQSLAQEVSNLQRSLNSDTKKAADSSFIYDRRQKLKEVYRTGLFPKEPVEKMFNHSTIKAFTNTKTGFDAFVGELFKELLEITNHPVFNETIVQLAKDDSELLYENKVVKPEKFRKTLKNDFISYLYQNNVFSEDDLNTVAKVVSKLFKPKTALANELADLKSKYPNLVENYPILSQLVGDRKPSKEKESDKFGLVNIKLKSKLSDRDELNSAVNQIRQLLQFNDVDFTKEEQLEIQNFTKKFVQFAIIQSGLNSSIYDLMDLVPNEEYTKGIAPFVNAFKEMLDTNPTLAKKEIQKFYNMRFKQQNPSFYKFKEFPQNINSTNIRGKNFIVSSSYDFTGKKKIAADLKEAEYINTLPSKTTTSPNTNSATIKNNPTSLVLVENNAKLTATQGLKESNFASIITKEAIGKPLLDANLPQNQELIDKFIKEIIDKSEDFTNIVFNEKGYGQHLLAENKRTFDYLSDQLYTYFGFQNPGYTPVAPREVIQPTAPEAITTVTTEVIEQPIQNKGGILQKQNIFTINPIQAADKKAIVKASVANKYIGFGEGIAGSSTELYKKQAGEFANVGNYNSDDVIFVSIGGKRGSPELRKIQQDKTIKEALKAIEAGATLITDNKSYVESSDYNEGEKRLAKNLEAKGYIYSEQTVDGQVLGVWRKFVEQPINKEIKEKELFNPKTTPINVYSTDNNGFKGLSNLLNGKVTFDGKTFATVEHLYQWKKAKFAGDNETADKLLKSNNGWDAQKLGKQVKGLNKTEWDKISSKELEESMRLAFEQNQSSKDLLLKTGDAKITHKAKFNLGKWEIEFPRILMEIRRELTQEQPIVEEKPLENPDYDPNNDPTCPF